MIRLEINGDLRILRLDKPRGNAIDEPLCRELMKVVSELGSDPSVKGVLLASAHPKLFSPGLDLKTLQGYERPELERFLGVFAEVVWALYAFPRPVVAAISGHAIAGGCILALTADYRILRRGGVKIGLNELRVGVPLPWSVTVLLRETLPGPALAEVALLGTSPSDEGALSLGLVHLLAGPEGFEEACLEKLRDFADRDPRAFSTTKSHLRRTALDAMRAREKETAQDFLDCWFSEATKGRIREIVDSLASKS